MKEYVSQLGVFPEFYSNYKLIKATIPAGNSEINFNVKSKLIVIHNFTGNNLYYTFDNSTPTTDNPFLTANSFRSYPLNKSSMKVYSSTGGKVVIEILY